MGMFSSYAYLSHHSVGTFLNHYSWNSTLVTLIMGVPMITWPMFRDHPFNSILLVERWGLAIRICMDVDGVPDEKEASRAVTRLLIEEGGKTMRRRATELRKHAKMAVNKDGSSFTDLQDFVRDMQQLHRKRVGMPEFEG